MTNSYGHFTVWVSVSDILKSDLSCTSHKPRASFQRWLVHRDLQHEICPYAATQSYMTPQLLNMQRYYLHTSHLSLPTWRRCSMAGWSSAGRPRSSARRSPAPPATVRSWAPRRCSRATDRNWQTPGRPRFVFQEIGRLCAQFSKIIDFRNISYPTVSFSKDVFSQEAVN